MKKIDRKKPLRESDSKSLKFLPPKTELEALYNGIHPDCREKHFSLRTLANYYAKKYQRKITKFKVYNWLKSYNIPIRDAHTARIPIPKQKELEALYDGILPECNSNPFNLTEIAEYYSKIYDRSVSRNTVKRWFRKYNIRIKGLKIPLPPKKELKDLYNGIHPECDGKPLSQYDIAEYYAKKYRRQIDQSTICLWFKECEIEARKMIPMPIKPELTSLYHGYHPDCGGEPFSQMEIAKYYSNKYKYPISRKTINRWLNRYKIEMRIFRIPLPPKKELEDLYNGIHLECDGKSLSQYEIAEYYTIQLKRNVDQTTVSNWFRKYDLEARNPTDSLLDDLWKRWEALTYEIAKVLLSDEIWESGHGKNRIKTPLIPEIRYIEPEIIVFFKNGEIKKLIDAKKTIIGINSKDIEVYPVFSKIVEFWILYGNSSVELHYSDSSKHITQDQFDEDECLADQNVEKILIFLSSSDLIEKLKQKINRENKKCILRLIKKIKLIKTGIRNNQTNLEEFLN
jgi:transposase